jgi:hypothetical protein
MAGDFYASIPVFGDFAQASSAEVYQALPDDWRVGFADVKGSTAAVAAGRYKAVNDRRRRSRRGLQRAAAPTIPFRVRRRRGEFCGLA